MGESAPPVEDSKIQPPEDDPTEEHEEDKPVEDGADRLGDAGKRALDAMKAKWKAERERAKAAEAERDQLKQASQSDDAAKKAEAERQAAITEATKKANARILRSEIKAAATGKLADPKDALTFLDLEQFEVSDDGEVDSDEVAQAIEDLIKNKPYLAAAKASRFQGTGDNGASGRKDGAVKQVTESELAKMSAEQIVKAQNEGRLADLLTGKVK